MHNSKRKQSGLPPRWLNCPRIGNVVNDMFVPFKTPLDKKFDSSMTSANRFSLELLFSSSKSAKIGLIINLTKTERYYNSEQLKGVKQFVRIPCEGHDGPPTQEQVNSFFDICSNFFVHFPNVHVGVHCTHGYNRTGFMIVSYLCEKCDVELDTAVQLFATARPPGIYKQDYLDELIKRYDYDGDELEAPLPPNWDDNQEQDISHYQEPSNLTADSSSENSDSTSVGSVKEADVFKTKSRKRKTKPRKGFTAPKEAAFMEGVGGVTVVTDTTAIEEIQQKVRDLMHTTRYDFVGSQPVSMTLGNIEELKKHYMVSWKADGTRYIMLIADEDQVYMLDRDNCVYKVNYLNFPKGGGDHYRDTLVDGEMVIDTYENVKTPRYLIYDIMALDAKYVGQLEFSKRLQLIKMKLIGERASHVSAQQKQKESFGVRLKEFWGLEKTQTIWEGVFRNQLLHKMDGLIFQPAGEEDSYVIGRCQSILKWKPSNLNSIDFQLRCEYSKKKDDVPHYVGYLYVTGESKYFGTIENIKKELRLKYNNKIVECSFNTKSLQWDIMRERTDKSIPNHISTAIAVLESIKNPVHIGHIYSVIYGSSDSN